MILNTYLQSKGIKQKIIDDLLNYIAPDGQNGFFWNARIIMTSHEIYGEKKLKQFVYVGSCPNGDVIAIDASSDSGAIFYIVLSFFGAPEGEEELYVKVAESPSDWITKMCDEEVDFPYDYWDAIEVFPVG